MAQEIILLSVNLLYFSFLPLLCLQKTYQNPCRSIYSGNTQLGLWFGFLSRVVNRPRGLAFFLMTIKHLFFSACASTCSRIFWLSRLTVSEYSLLVLRSSTICLFQITVVLLDPRKKGRDTRILAGQVY
ncbi:hypothetical protein F5884DRAFT_7104 [Xylogone sp. PMI_703]|nr:hypothetical protein F5884DRAFT_7104 [Xylogone sp. PMI_703]